MWITEDVQRTEYELGSDFSKAELQKALKEGEYEPEITPRSIQAEWDNKDKKAKWEQDVEVPLPEDVVLKIGSDGILIAVPNTEEQLFLSIAAKKQVDQRIVKLRLAEQEIQRLNERREQDRGKEGQVL